MPTVAGALSVASAAGAYLRMLVSSVSVGQLDSPQALRQQDVARRGCSTYCTSAAGVVICSERESPDEHFLEKASALLSRAQAWFGLAGSPGVGLRGGVDHAVLADCLLSACSQQGTPRIDQQKGCFDCRVTVHLQAAAHSRKQSSSGHTRCSSKDTHQRRRRR